MANFTLLSMAAHFGKVIAVLPLAEREALEEACKLVEAEAHSEPGTYQGAAGPFAAWEPLKDETIARKTTGDSPLLETGELAASYEHVVQGRSGHVGSNDDKAVWQELGTSRIPPRSVIGHSAVTKEDEIHKITGHHILGALMSGGVSHAVIGT